MKLVYFAILGLSAISIANAGQIEIGGGSNGTISTQGLLASWITSNGGSLNSWTERTYSANLFTNDTVSLSSLGGSTTPTSANGYQQFTDANTGITFAMLNDGNNYLGSPATAGSSIQSSIVIPIGIMGLTTANIMLNDYYGVNPLTNADTVRFTFASAGSVDFNLTNGNQIGDATNCTSGTSTWTVTATPTCYQMAGLPTSPSTSVAWTAHYSNSNTATNATLYSSTSGFLDLLDLSFDISAYSGDTLNSITIIDNFNLNNNSRLALSAITVSTPEPSSVLLLFGGLGVIGILAQRRRVQ